MIPDIVVTVVSSVLLEKLVRRANANRFLLGAKLCKIAVDPSSVLRENVKE
jgi:hypothetical protein